MNRKPEPGWAFRMMSLIHDNLLRRNFTDPYKPLKAAGLNPGQNVLEIGCGPGFFTIPAAKIVGEKGTVYALDIHPLAMERVQEKIRKEGITNVKTILADASQTGLPDQSMDLAFLFGIAHSINEILKAVLDELYRVLKPGGILSIKTRISEKKLTELLEKKGFIYSENREGIFLFKRKK